MLPPTSSLVHRLILALEMSFPLTLNTRLFLLGSNSLRWACFRTMNCLSTAFAFLSKPHLVILLRYWRRLLT